MANKKHSLVRLQYKAEEEDVCQYVSVAANFVGTVTH